MKSTETTVKLNGSFLFVSLDKVLVPWFFDWGKVKQEVVGVLMENLIKSVSYILGEVERVFV